MEVEFSDRQTGEVDLRPSAYQVGVDTAELVRVTAEHQASFLRSPQLAVAIDMEGLAEAKSTPGSTAFSFANARHRELLLQSVEQLRRILALIRHTDDGRCLRRVEKEHIERYVRGRLQAKDAEWNLAVSSLERLRRWKVVSKIGAGKPEPGTE